MDWAKRACGLCVARFGGVLTKRCAKVSCPVLVCECDLLCLSTSVKSRRAAIGQAHQMQAAVVRWT